MATALSRTSRGERVRWIVAVAVALPWLAWAAVRLSGVAVPTSVTLALAFTPYAALTSIVPVLVALLLRRWIVAGVALLAATGLAAAVLPRAFSGDSPPTTPGGASLTVMSLNMDDGRADAPTIARLVREHDVDVLAVVELKGALAALRRAGVTRALPETQVSPWSRGGGAALLSRTPLAAVARSRLGQYPEPPAARVATGGGVELVVVHPPHPTKPRYEEEWTRRLRALPASESDQPRRLLLGDFNATLDQRQLRDVLDRGYEDAAAATGEGLVGTWPADRWPRIAIDHVLVDRRLVVRGFSVLDVPGTDHRAIVAEVEVPA